MPPQTKPSAVVRSRSLGETAEAEAIGTLEGKDSEREKARVREWNSIVGNIQIQPDRISH